MVGGGHEIYRKQSKMSDVNPTISVTKLNMTGLDIPIK